MRSTREHRAGRPLALAQEPRSSRGPLLTLLQVGFTEPLESPRALVVSYTTVSPLPPGMAGRRSVFCGTVPRVAPGRRYRPPCPWSPDLPRRARGRLARRGRPADSPAAASSLWWRTPAWRMISLDLDFRRRQGGRPRHRAPGPPAPFVQQRSPWLADQAAQQTAVILAVALLRRSCQRKGRHLPPGRRRPVCRAAG